MKVKFRDWNCTVQKASYENGRMALILLDEADGSRIAVASVNLPEQPLMNETDYVYIKNWSENEGMLEALTEAGIVEPIGVRTPTGRVYADLCKFTGEG